MLDDYKIIYMDATGKPRFFCCASPVELGHHRWCVKTQHTMVKKWANPANGPTARRGPTGLDGTVGPPRPSYMDGAVTRIQKKRKTIRSRP